MWPFNAERQRDDPAAAHPYFGWSWRFRLWAAAVVVAHWPARRRALLISLSAVCHRSCRKIWLPLLDMDHAGPAQRKRPDA
jgi:hypothetical protein